ncbi:TonB system transport protein ExbD [Pseudomonas sp. FME51]|uniref:TonB system transport protein ExbD n=1 Tax=Pseudomonas sp. FME51 TaxID=2742609 RepID=UPI00186950F5|nr:TonB system transport protein ExbD [Pseudomonas sp. FME51]
MAFHIQDTSTADLPDNHEINVTPFIDVMLVLLIIFMVAAPLATVSVPVDLPASSATPQPTPDEPLYLTIQTDLSLTLGDDLEVERERLADNLRQLAPDEEQRIFLRADQSVPYGELMEVMNVLGSAGYLKVALVGLERPAEGGL